MGAAGTPTFRGKGSGGGSTPTGPAGGDLTGFYPNPTLIATGVVPATYGDSTHWPQIIVDGKGRITFAQNIAASGGISGIIVKDEGSTIGTATTLDFVGAGVTATFATGVATITIPGGGTGADCTTAPDLTCRLGRTGTNNDTLISLDANGTLTGSGTSGSNLIVHSNTSLDGFTEFDGNVRIKNSALGNGQIVGGVASGSLEIFAIEVSTATSITGPSGIRGIFVDFDALNAGLTITDAAYAPLILCNGNISVAATTSEASVFGVIASGQVTITDSTQNVLIGLFSTSLGATADGTTQTLSLGNSVEGALQFNAINGGVLTVSKSIVYWDNTGTNTDSSGGVSVTVTDHATIMTQPNVGDFTTFSNRRGLWFKDYFDSSGPFNIGQVINQIAVDVEDLPQHVGNAGVLFLSLRSVGSTVEMRHVGPAVFGANAAPTGAYILEAIGDAHVSGKLTVDGAIDPTDLLFSGVDNTFEGSLSTDGDMLYNTDLGRIRARYGSAWHSVASTDDVAPIYETFTGPSSSVSLGMSPSLIIAFKNGVQQHKITGTPNEGEYDLSGSTLTVTLASGDILDVYEWA